MTTCLSPFILQTESRFLIRHGTVSTNFGTCLWQWNHPPKLANHYFDKIATTCLMLLDHSKFLLQEHANVLVPFGAISRIAIICSWNMPIQSNCKYISWLDQGKNSSRLLYIVGCIPQAARLMPGDTQRLKFRECFRSPEDAGRRS